MLYSILAKMQLAFYLVLLSSFIISPNVHGQILTFDFIGLSGNEATAVSNFNDPNANSSIISRGSGLTASANADRFNATSWAASNIGNAISGNDYMEFIISPTSGFQLDITSIDVIVQRSGTGPREIVLRSSLDGFTLNLGGSQTIADNTASQAKTFSFIQSSATSITYRFYMWAEATGGSGGFEGSGNDIIVNGTVSSASGPDPEPTNYSTLLSCSTISSDQIDLSWTDAVGTQLPAGYLIKWSDVSYAAITNPTDGSDSNGASSLTEIQGTESASVSDLDPNTQYFFKIWSYTNSGSNIDYKTSAGVPQTDCTTDNGPCFEESFDNNNTSSSGYSDGSFTGDEGTLWAYEEARNPSAAFQITGTSIGFDDSGNGFVSTTWPSGVGNLSYDTRSFFTGGYASNRTIEVWVSGVLRESFTLGLFNTVYSRTIANINAAGSVDVEFRSTGSRQIVIDNISWTCFSGCTATQTITSFLPTSGPAGTLVTISGSGFTGATAASFSGTTSPFVQVVDDNTLIAEVPESGTSGAVGITVSSCEALSSSNFTFISDNGSCGSSSVSGTPVTELFISEVYDAESGSLSYIEVFNGTNAAIANLTTDQYVLRIQTGATNIFDYSMSGSLASGATYILRVGSGSSICTNFTPDDDQPSGQGFNGDDNIYLLKNGSVIDDVPNPNVGSGFSQSRNATVTSPSTIYIPSEWTIGTTENCGDLSVPPFIINGSDITINTQPADVDCAALTFTVDAAATPDFVGGTSGAYTWKFLAPETDSWENVSTLNGSNGLTVTGSNTPAISVSGPTAVLVDYQFYVDMGTSGSPQCRVSSNAAQYTYETRAFYQTTGNGSGEWTDVLSWEMSDSEGGAYIGACQYPLDRNSQKVIIRSGHSINFDNVDVSADELEIESGATLTIETSGELLINNGNTSGADLVVEGTFVDKAVSPNGIEFDTDATWELAPTGTIVKTNTSSVSRYRDEYEAGIVNIPASANWIYRREGTSEVSVVATGMYYPNLTFENFGGAVYDPTDAQRFFQGSSSAPVIYGDLDIGGEGTGGYVVRTNNTNLSSILVEGNLTIRSGSTFTNDHATGSNDGTGLEVRGDLDINGSLNLSASGTSPQRGQLLLTGGIDQIGTGSGSISVNRLEINKSAGDILTETKISVAQNAAFTNGILKFDESATSALLELANGATHSGASVSSFVHGKVRKIGYVASSEFEFPVGYYNALANPVVQVYQPASLIPSTSSASAAFDIRYVHENYNAAYSNPFNKPPRDPSLIPGTVSTCNYWMIDPVPAAPTINANVKLSWGNSDCLDIDDNTFLTVARWNGIAWDNQGEIGVTGTSIGTVTSGAVSNFSPFAIGTTGASLNILPITLLSFSAEASERKVLTNWTTATEINNDFFTIERSKDGNFWEKVGTIEGAGDSHAALSYSFTDQRPYPGVSYYRLRQTDFDGATTLSEPRAVEILLNGDFGLDQVYHAQVGLNLVYRSNSPNVTVEIYDLIGKRVHGQQVDNSGNGFGTIYPDLARGAYVLRLSDGAETDSEKFVW